MQNKNRELLKVKSNNYWQNIALAVQYLQQEDILSPKVDKTGYCSIRVGSRVKKVKAVDLVYASWYPVKHFTTERIIQIDLNTDNYSPRNLKAISKKVYLALKEALLNLNGALRLAQHPEDQFKVVLEYRENGRRFKRVFEDAEPAKRLLLQKKLQACKVINMYCLV